MVDSCFEDKNTCVGSLIDQKEINNCIYFPIKTWLSELL